jgi:hypothetical protein
MTQLLQDIENAFNIMPADVSKGLTDKLSEYVITSMLNETGVFILNDIMRSREVLWLVDVYVHLYACNTDVDKLISNYIDAVCKSYNNDMSRTLLGTEKEIDILETDRATVDELVRKFSFLRGVILYDIARNRHGTT